MRQNYDEYHYTKREALKYTFQSILLCAAADWLFYQSRILILAAVPLTPLFLRWKKGQLIRERTKKLNYQFRDALNALSTAVQAG